MNDYVEVRLDVVPCSETITDVLAALLCDVGYESFVPDRNGLSAYIKREIYDIETLEDVINQCPMDASITYRAIMVEGQDWNAEWEKNYFKPIVVDDECVIHSSFHKNIPQLTYDIVIDPKMAFGTGHHQTTSQIIRQLLTMQLNGKSVIDMGTGTGILAILAAMRGAMPVSAIEIDEFAYVNAVENVSLNGHPEINVIHGDATALESLDDADVFIANINRNIILGDIQAYCSRLKVGGVMLLSGFYEHDVPMIRDAASALGLTYVTHTIDNNWACLILKKNI